MRLEVSLLSPLEPLACADEADLLRRLRPGVDGLVLARSAFNSSMHYRCVMVFGTASAVTEETAKAAALERLTDQLMPGRRAELRPSTRKEINATSVLALPIDTFSVKVSDGPPEDPKRDLDQPVCYVIDGYALSSLLILENDHFFGEPAPGDRLERRGNRAPVLERPKAEEVDATQFAAEMLAELGSGKAKAKRE